MLNPVQRCLFGTNERLSPPLAVSPAVGVIREAGLQRGDILTAIGGEDVTNVLDLVAAIRAHEPGEEVEVVFWRAGEEHTVTATLDAAEAGS
jgi:S1-C subfamily serine protease